MEKSYKKKILFLIIFLVFIPFTLNSQTVKGSFLYSLSNFTGTIPYSWPRVVLDQQRDESYVLYQNIIKIFNDSGMEVYSFGDDLDIGSIVDLVIDKGGNIILLSYKYSEINKINEYQITRCNFRGEPVSKIEIKNLPSSFSEFFPNRMVYRDEELYLASLSAMKVVVIDGDGGFKKGYEILPLLQLDEREKADAMMDGFSVDGDGNIFFTIPPLFKAYKISSDRKIRFFGRPGSSPGRFNVVAGIATDRKGNILIVDKLKCSVMVFDKDFKFLTQFGSRGYRAGDLIAPDDIKIDRKDRVYVTQALNRGVSIFKLNYN